MIHRLFLLSHALDEFRSRLLYHSTHLLFCFWGERFMYDGLRYH
jgi:hypothetical protein